VPGTEAERELVRVMLTTRGTVTGIAERVGVDRFRDPRYRAIFAAMLRLGADALTDELFAEMPDAPSTAALQELLAQPDAVIDARKTIDDSVARLQIREIEERLVSLGRAIQHADEAEKTVLTTELMKLRDERSAIGRGSWRKLRELGA
jgi:replicative DNA helicase